MRIPFAVDDTPCEFHRDPFIGATELRVGGQVLSLQSVLNPGTHFELGLTRSWERRFGERVIRVEKRRPLLFGGLRPNDYRVFVDGQLVAERRGF